MKLLRLWFGLSVAVRRREYLASGVALMFLKVLIDNALALKATGKIWPPLAYLAPSWTYKSSAIGPSPSWLLLTMAFVALPFVWIGVSMSVRRAADAGWSPFAGLLFLVPIVNYVAMIVLAAVPSSRTGASWVPPPPGPYRARDEAPASLPKREMEPGVKATLMGLLASISLGLAMVTISIYSMQLYGAAVFFGTPFVMGVATAFAYNRHVQRSLAMSVALALLSVIITGSVILLFAMEGLLCLVMALPIAAALAVLGAIAGWAMARQAGARTAHLMVAFLALPGLAEAEHQTASPRLHEVTTSIEIDAPPERVWPNVIGFSELPPPPEIYFKLGIAYPMRANISGEGIGAVRRCEFSTGPFVEPITVWDEPRRLAFDVTSQPPSMTELSPYRDVKAAHLEGYMVSRRGEFRLVPLEGGRTRLEGSTWYTLAIFPEDYWTIWGEALLHSIHGRVLSHIKRLSESGARD
ncbi:MAG: SRPBCC family protein [Labilithrix sp.]|nr:SRPBCC family protein [Labilithrix sp.]